MKLAMIALLVAISSPAFACGQGECEPPPPPPPPPPPTEITDGDSVIPGDPIYLPCCIQDGKLVAKRYIFMKPDKVMKMCQRHMDRNSPYIYECDIGGEEALK